MKRGVAIVAIVLLVGMFLLKHKLPAATGISHIPAPQLTYAQPATRPEATNGGFLDNINVSLKPPPKIHDPSPASAGLSLHNDSPPANPAKLQTRPADTIKTPITWKDRELNYEVFGSDNLTLKLNLKPTCPNPNTFFPTRLDPGLGVSIKF